MHGVIHSDCGFEFFGERQILCHLHAFELELRVQIIYYSCNVLLPVSHKMLKDLYHLWLALVVLCYLPMSSLGQSGPPNDMFTNAIVIGGTIATVTGSNEGATTEPGEPVTSPRGGKSVWWKWTAPSNAPLS